MSTRGDVTQRFSDRVADYVRWRPDYPRALVSWLQQHGTALPGNVVADIGAGTGISARLLLDAGCVVTGVEPNAPMRAAMVELLGSNPRFRALPGRAEATGLPGASVALITVAQAFHWFDPVAVRAEWSRVLQPGGLVAIFWNTRRTSGTPFLEKYEQLLWAFCPEYANVAERHADAAQMRAWFGAGLVAEASFDHAQSFDLPGLRGRLLSSSYAPAEGHPQHEPMMQALAELFAATAESGRVSFGYDTQVWLGRLVSKSR